MPTHNRTSTLAIWLLFALCPTLLMAQDEEAPRGGTLTGRFVYEGPYPQQEKVITDRVADVYDESLVVDLETRGISNILVWLHVKPVGGTLPVPVDPDKDISLPAAHLTVSPKRFDPRVVIAPIGKESTVTNASDKPNNVSLQWLKNTAWVENLKAGESATFQPKRREGMPSVVTSPTYPWLRGYVFVPDHPYVAVSDVSGRFVIPHLPPGKWTFTVWHERAGFVNDVTLDGTAALWKAGRVEFDITPGDNDLGEIIIGAKEFAQ